MGVLSDSGKPLYWASGNLVVRRYARAYIAHEPTFVPEHRIFSEEALEWDLFSWGDATGRIKYYSPEWKALDVSSLPSDISGDARYDVARAQLGGNWRLPTEAEWWRLRENATIRYEGAGKYFKIWVTSKINGNVLCFYAADYLAFLDPDYSQLRCDYTCFLTGNRRVAQFSYFISDMLVDKPDVGGMFFVRPVTE